MIYEDRSGFHYEFKVLFQKETKDLKNANTYQLHVGHSMRGPGESQFAGMDICSTSEIPVVHTENCLNARLIVAHQRGFGEGLSRIH